MNEAVNKVAEKVALLGYGTCMTSATISAVEALDKYLHIAVSLVGIVSGICAAIYYIRKSRQP